MSWEFPKKEEEKETDVRSRSYELPPSTNETNVRETKSFTPAKTLEAREKLWALVAKWNGVQPPTTTAHSKPDLNPKEKKNWEEVKASPEEKYYCCPYSKEREFQFLRGMSRPIPRGVRMAPERREGPQRWIYRIGRQRKLHKREDDLPYYLTSPFYLFGEGDFKKD